MIKRNSPPFKRKKKRAKKNNEQKIILDNKIRIPFPYTLEKEIRAAFTMLNPEYLQICKKRGYKASERPLGYVTTKEKKDGRWTTRKIPQHIYYWDFDDPELAVPRGGFRVIQNLFKRHGKRYKLIKNRPLLESTNFKFHGKLMESKGQKAILKWKAKTGILQSGTGTGKTVMSLYQAAVWQQPTVVVVDTKELQKQWVRRIKKFYKLKESQIGMIGSGTFKIKPITVALMQTLREKTELLKHFGTLIVDECHVVATESYETIVNNFHGTYIMGLSATPRRKDGKTRVMFWLLGRIHVKVDPKEVKKLKATGVFVSSDYEGEIDFRKAYAKAKAAMLADEDRNKLIVKTITDYVDLYGIHLIISSSSKHLEQLIEMMPHHFKLTSRLLVGTVKDSDREEIVKDAMQNKLKFIFATDKLIGKGFDEERMSVLHMVSPVADKYAIEQFCGRVTRVPIDKKVRKLKKRAYVFYYFDFKENTLRGAASTASKKFHELGFKKRILRKAA